MNDGIILLNSERGGVFGFTSDKFHGDSYLFKEGNNIFVSFIECVTPGCGHFRELVQAILRQGYAVKVPTPGARMGEILLKNGFTHAMEPAEEVGTGVMAHMWTLQPPATPV